MDTFIIGTGSLAEAVVNALSQASMGPLRIAVIGRSAAKVSRLALMANARAAVLGTSLTFLSLEIAQFKALAFARAIRSLKPKVIFHAASIQSPWEVDQGQNGWTKLVASAGFGITLTLQLALAAQVSRGAADSEAAIVKASYPDCVNVALHRWVFEPRGIGNSAVVEAFCRSHVKGKNGDVRVVGHHGQLSVWLKGKRFGSRPRVWGKAGKLRVSPYALTWGRSERS